MMTMVTLIVMLAAMFLVAVVWATGLTLVLDAVVGARRRLLGMFLLEHLYALARMEVPLSRGLAECASQKWSASQRDITMISYGLNAGVPLGDALALVSAEAPTGPIPPRRIISPAEAEILRVGESSGNMAEALRLVTQERRRSLEGRNLLFAGFLYPLMVIVVVAGVAAGFFTFIVPKFNRMFEELGTGAPALVALNKYGAIWRAVPLLGFIMMICLTAVMFVPILHRPLVRTRDHFSDVVRRVIGAIPFIGGGMRRAALGEFCYEMAMLARAGTPAPRALEMIAEGTIHPSLRDRVLRAAELTRSGVSLAQALDEAKVDPRAAWFARGLGGPEELSRALIRLGEDYSVQTTWFASLAGQLLPPLAIMGLGVSVGMIVLGVFLPLLRLIAGMSATT